MRSEELAAKLGDLTGNREAMAQLILQGERAVPAVAAVLLGPPSSIAEPRCLAAEILGAIGGEAALSALIRALTIHDVRRLDPVLRLAEEAVRNRAAEQLGKLGNRRAIGPLIYALAREGVRGAMGALAQFGEPGGIRYVVRRLEDPCDRVAAADAVLRYGRIAVPDLAATLIELKPSAEDEALMSMERRAEAARLLGVLGDDRVIPTLEAYLEDSAPRSAARGGAGPAGPVASRCAGWGTATRGGESGPCQHGRGRALHGRAGIDGGSQYSPPRRRRRAESRATSGVAPAVRRCPPGCRDPGPAAAGH
ncbi:MAG TPA: hypothetical protein VMD08_11885 [Candidatus Baltobacteraceae bacterium]|nr:hypothetical protein [Candidatus Baltobacteraceae bacterium]